MQILLKGIKFDFPLFKELKIDWKLPKNQFSIFSVIRKIENWIENCQKTIFSFFSLSEKLKTESKIAQNQLSFYWNYLKLNKNDMDVFVHGYGCSMYGKYNLLLNLKAN